MSVADMMLDGTLCQMCGVYLGSDAGYPVTCNSCKAEEAIEVGIARRKGGPTPNKKNRVPCPTCGKRVKGCGLVDHLRDAHGAV